ncbi:MAG: PaaI family thioesterase [Chloroflexota bacterium]|nr:PaaI family thioesterase [Chloroflexota bacterium]
MSFWKGPSFRSRDHFPMCIVCGKENPVGLKIEFRQEGNTVKAEFTPREVHQGWPDIVHGGLLSLLLDEATVYVPRYLGFNAVTARSEIRLRQPVRVGQRLFISAWPVRQNRRLCEAAGQIDLADGTTVAEGKAVMYIVEEA